MRIWPVALIALHASLLPSASSDCIGPCVVNAGFEVPGCPPPGWLVYAPPLAPADAWADPGGSVCASKLRAHSGVRSLQVSDPGIDRYTAAASPPFRVAEGDIVHASAWASGEGRRMMFGLEFRNFAGDYVPAPFVDVVLTDAWQPFLVEAPAPPTSRFAYLVAYSCSGCAGTFYVDDVTLDYA